MIRIPLALLGVLLVTSSARGDVPPPAVSVAWFGETLLHPGLRAGADFKLLERGRHRLLAGGHLGGYLHRGNHVGLLADAEIGYRFTFSGGVFLEVRLGAGYLRTFLHGDVYERGDDGAFEQRSLGGANGFAPSQTVGVGYDLSRRFDRPLSVFLLLGAFEQYPFNSGWSVHAMSQLGLSWQLGAAR